MDKRLEVRCTDEQLARWKEAAGEASLSSWLRAAADAFVEEREVFTAVPLGSFSGGLVRDVPSVPAPVRPEFRPDFGSRLKEK
jgi:hypothetical protein